MWFFSDTGGNGAWSGVAKKQKRSRYNSDRIRNTDANYTIAAVARSRIQKED